MGMSLNGYDFAVDIFSFSIFAITTLAEAQLRGKERLIHRDVFRTKSNVYEGSLF